MPQLPPSFIEGERAILGGLLIDNSQALQVCEEISAQDFYREAHRFIFSAMSSLIQRDMPIDWTTLTDELRKGGKLEAVGGSGFLVELVDAIPSASNIMHYVQVVKEKAGLRKVISSAAEIKSLCENGTSFEEVLERTESLALTAASMKVKDRGHNLTEFKPFSKIMGQCIEAADKTFTKQTLPGLTTGFRDIDNCTTGFHGGDLHVICGRPGMGKTSLALTIARANANKGIPVGIFELEMGEEQTGQRIIVRETAMNLRCLRMGEFTQDGMDKIVTEAGNLSDLPIDVYAPHTISPQQIRFRARALSVRHKINYGMVIADHIGLMNSGRRLKREEEISTISREMKQLAKELNIPVIVLAQLNRELEKRPDNQKRPRLSDLRESGAIEQDADVVIGLFQPYHYTGKDEDRGNAEAIILKQRNGPVGTIELDWIPETASYWDKRKNFSHGETL